MKTIEATLKECLQSPAIAMQHLPELLDAVAGTDEDLMEQANEVLENAGAPQPDQLEFLRGQLMLGSSQKCYWACTLLGRLGEQANVVQEALVPLIVATPSLELHAKEKAAWCLGQIGRLNERTRSALEKQKEQFPPRLKRLVDSALTSSVISS